MFSKAPARGWREAYSGREYRVAAFREVLWVTWEHAVLNSHNGIVHDSSRFITAESDRVRFQ